MDEYFLGSREMREEKKCDRKKDEAITTVQYRLCSENLISKIGKEIISNSCNKTLMSFIRLAYKDSLHILACFKTLLYRFE